LSAIKQTAAEVYNSVTGFEEIAVATHFGHTVEDLGANDVRMFARSMVFVVKRREGLDDAAAREAALALPFKELNENFFAADSEEKAGKDEQPEEQPEPSLSSVSEPDEPRLSISS
jgi:hypothetical protein